MKRSTILMFSLLMCSAVMAQSIKVEYDKKRDFSSYKSFQFGEGEIVIPKDQLPYPNSQLKSWIEGAVNSELTNKGLVRADSAADLIVSYVLGSVELSESQNLGPLGVGPGNSSSQVWSRNSQQYSLIIDLNDKNKTLVWRVNSVSAAAKADLKRLMEQTVNQGFKKLTLEPPRHKKKK